MNSNQICPVCNGPINPGDHECRRCGFRLAGSTEILTPIANDSGAFAPAPGKASVRYSLYVSKGPQVNEAFFLESPQTVLGRDPKCDIFLNDMTVSREHAIISVAGDKAAIHDNGSLNGTWVDGTIVDDALLHDGSVIQIGTFKIVFQEHEV